MFEELLKTAAWGASQSGSGVIVFKANDFVDPGASTTLADIAQAPALQRDVKNFASVCRGGFSEVPTLADFLAGKNIPQQIVVIGATAAPSHQPIGYISQYPVVNGSDYARFAAFVGSMVELVGQVTKVKLVRTRYGKEMAFINLGAYPGCVALTLWPEALSTAGEKPGPTWEGRWISIRGLVEPPNKKQKHPAAFVQVANLSQLHQLSEKEARYRLAGPGVGQGRVGKATSNADLLAGMQKPGGRITTTSPGPSALRVLQPPRQVPPPPPATANQRILDSMRQNSPASASGGRHAPPTAPSQHRQVSVPPSAPTKSTPGWVWILGFFIVVAVLRSVFGR